MQEIGSDMQTKKGPPAGFKPPSIKGAIDPEARLVAHGLRTEKHYLF